MKPLSARMAIVAAEQKLRSSKRELAASRRRLQAEIRAQMARPSSLMVAAGVAGVIGFRLARRPRPSARKAKAPAVASVMGLASAFLVRYGKQYALRHLTDMWRANRAAATPVRTSARQAAPRPNL